MKRFALAIKLGSLSVFTGMTMGGCPGGDGLVASLRPPPVIIPFGSTQDTFVRSFEVDLSDYPETRSINWEFGDGSMQAGLPVSQGRIVSHTFSSNGTFQVIVHLFGPPDLAAGTGPEQIGVGSLPVDVTGPNELPIADFTVQEVFDDLGQTVSLARRFSALGSRDPDGTIELFEWDFGDGTTGEGIDVEHTYENSGRFVVRLTVTDDRGGEGTTTRTVLANSLPEAQFTFSIDATNALRVNFDGTGSSDADGPLTEFSWDFGDDSDEAFGAVISHTYAEPGDYTVVLTVTDEFGAMDSASQVVDVVGSEPFVRSVAPDVGIVGSNVVDAVLDGENFQSGATVLLRQGATPINGTSVEFVSPTTLRADFDLSAAPLGDYDVIVINPDNSSATRIAGFRVVTPDRVRLVTSMGDIVLDLVEDAPISTANFLEYVTDDFYNGTIFHRVIPDFVVQGGSELPDGSPQTPVRPPIQNEFSPTRSNIRGTVAYAKLPNNPNSATSGFFFNLDDNSENLDNQNGGFTVFANVIEGMDVVDAMAAVPLDGEQPVTDIVLIRAERE
ncbi:MAG TPA: PKD domain-containing protein [Phycisphaerae bacterium]|nr:PKD domain-containing protein [Phycisphaerae bacterium]